MFLSYLTHPVVVAALISFFVGSFGYIIAVLVIRPVLSYQLLRREIRKAVHALSAVPETGGSPAFNALSLRLTENYQKNLPQWYQLVLSNRSELPLEAARDLTRLAKTHDSAQVLKRIAAIQSALHLN